MNLAKRLKVEPGSKVKLSDIDPNFHGTHESEDEAKAELQHNLDRITELQRKFYADRRHSLLIVLQGIDGAGKDGTCWHVVSAMDPQGVSVTGFKQPTAEERDHDFLWRVHPHAPGLGQVSVFNRSHYEDVLVVRVHDLVPKHVWKQRFEFINNWERLLVEEKNTTILKFFLYISKDEQLSRFKDRLDDPTRQWKISDSDYSERKLWDKYIGAFEGGDFEMLHQACAMVHHSLQPQVVQEFGRFRDCCSCDGGYESQPAEADSRLAEDSQALPSSCRRRSEDEEIEKVT